MKKKQDITQVHILTAKYSVPCKYNLTEVFYFIQESGQKNT